MKNNLFSNWKKAFKNDEDDIAKIILKTFKDFGIKMELIEAKPGPTVSYFTFKLLTPTRMKDLDGFDRDLCYALGTSLVRIEAPVMDASLIGIEVPNKKREFVALKDMWKHKEFFKNQERPIIPLGRVLGNKDLFLDLFQTPHLLISGSSNTGKSNFLHCLINSLIHKFEPRDMKLVLVDTEEVDFNIYDGVPHLLSAPIEKAEKVVGALLWLNGEMERRYRLLVDSKSKDIIEHNRKVEEKLPFIIFIADELDNIYDVDRIEETLIRILQMGRAVGLDVILCTSKFKKNMAKDRIYKNIGSRLCFAVKSPDDSKEILGLWGAERLLWDGDALFQDTNHIRPIRIYLRVKSLS